MEQDPNKPVHLSPELKALFDQAFVEDVETWSVGKLRAFLEAHSISARKMKSPIMKLQAKKIMLDRLKPIDWNK